MTQHEWFYQACAMAMYVPDAHNDDCSGQIGNLKHW